MTGAQIMDVLNYAATLIEMISGAALYTNFVKTRQRYFSKELEQLQVAYQAIFTTYKQTARLLFGEITATLEFHDILQAANIADASTQDRLRELLLSTLRPRQILNK